MEGSGVVGFYWKVLTMQANKGGGAVEKEKYDFYQNQSMCEIKRSHGASGTNENGTREGSK